MNRYNFIIVKKQGIIQRMKDLISMWRLVSFFKQNRLSLALELTRIIAKLEARREMDFVINEELVNKSKELRRTLTKAEIEVIYSEHNENEGGFSEYMANNRVNSYHREALVERSVLVERYLTKCHKRSGETNEDETLKIKIIEIESIIESCITTENGPYIQIDEDNNAFLLLTNKGKMFATYSGLFKAVGHELNEFITDWQTVVYAIIALIGAMNIGLLKMIALYLYHLTGR